MVEESIFSSLEQSLHAIRDLHSKHRCGPYTDVGRSEPGGSLSTGAEPNLGQYQMDADSSAHCSGKAGLSLEGQQELSAVRLRAGEGANIARTGTHK